MIRLIRPECPNPAALDAKNYKDPVNKQALRESTSGKCMYCESKIGHNSYPHVEHIKPKKKFPELEFSWNNLGFSCPVCNTNKGEKYNEDIPFINPYNDEPEDYFVFLGFFVFPKQGSERGGNTINELGLNRPNLVDGRKDKIKKIKELTKMIKAASFLKKNEFLCNQAIAELKKDAEKDKEYSAMVKSVLIAEGIL